MTLDEFKSVTLSPDPTMKGRKIAVRIGSILYVSPAMHELLTLEQDNPKAFARLLAAITIEDREPRRKRRKFW